MRRPDLLSEHQQGITMIEILVAMVIVSIGLLWAAAMTINGLESNRNAYQRTQASMLAYDIADRMRANPEGNYQLAGLGSAPSMPQCFSAGQNCSISEMADADLARWVSIISGDGGSVVGELPSPGAEIILNGDVYTVTIEWEQVAWDEANNAFEDAQTQTVQLEVRI